MSPESSNNIINHRLNNTHITLSVTAWYNIKKHGWFGLFVSFSACIGSGKPEVCQLNMSPQTLCVFSLIRSWCWGPLLTNCGSNSQNSEAITWRITIPPACLLISWTYVADGSLQLYVECCVSGHEGLFLTPGVKIHTRHNTVHGPGCACRRVHSSIYPAM